MWQAASLIMILASFLLVQRQLRRLGDDWLTKLAVVLIWIRLAAAALGEVALKTEIAGFSLMALSTLATTALALVLIPMHLFRVPRLLPFLAFAAFGAFGAILNGALDSLKGFLVLWAFFAVLSVLLFRGFAVHGHPAVLRCLAAAFALPFAMQAVSLVLGMPKIAPDGTLNYIGGYGHEAIFALVAVAALWLAATYPWQRPGQGLALIALLVASLLLANYRTIIIAILPLLLAFVLLRTGASPFHALRRWIIPLILLGLLAPALLPEQARTRFAELGAVMENAGNLAQPPEEFTAREKDVLSARAYIWAVYLYGFLDADLPQFLVGHSPDARAPGFSVHAHNEYLRLLFEFGLVGAVLWFGVLIHQCMLALRARVHPVGPLTVAGFATMLLAALGTSVFNRPEGIILLALLCATAWHLADQERMPSPAARRMPPRPLDGALRQGKA